MVLACSRIYSRFSPTIGTQIFGMPAPISTFLTVTVFMVSPFSPKQGMSFKFTIAQPMVECYNGQDIKIPYLSLEVPYG